MINLLIINTATCASPDFPFQSFSLTKDVILMNYLQYGKINQIGEYNIKFNSDRIISFSSKWKMVESKRKGIEEW